MAALGAHHWRDRGKRDDALELLAPVYGWFTEGFDTPQRSRAGAGPAAVTRLKPRPELSHLSGIGGQLAAA